MYLQAGDIIWLTHYGVIHDARYWNSIGIKLDLTNRKIRSSNYFCRSWAASLCYPPIHSIKYVWTRQFLLSHCIENVLLTPASTKMCKGSGTKVELGVRTEVGPVGERGNLAFLVLLEWMAKPSSSKITRKIIVTQKTSSFRVNCWE